MKRLILIDNYDSFTYNLLHVIASQGVEVIVHRNDKITIDELRALTPDLLCISPGPGRPDEAGISKEAIRNFAEEIPILGVCLGMQALNEVFGGSTVHASLPVHGKTSEVRHSGIGIMSGVPTPFRAARYHSLCIGAIGNGFEVTATSDDGVAMCIRHERLPIAGVQFHPESFLTQHGDAVIRNFLAMVRQ